MLILDLDEKGLAPTVRTPLACREGVEERRAAETAPLPASTEDSRLTVGAKHGLVVRSINVDMVEVGVFVVFKGTRMGPREYQCSVLSRSDAGKAPARDAIFIWMVACSTPIRLSPPKP